MVGIVVGRDVALIAGVAVYRFLELSVHIRLFPALRVFITDVLAGFPCVCSALLCSFISSCLYYGYGCSDWRSLCFLCDASCRYLSCLVLFNGDFSSHVYMLRPCCCGRVFPRSRRSGRCVGTFT